MLLIYYNREENNSGNSGNSSAIIFVGLGDCIKKTFESSEIGLLNNKAKIFNNLKVQSFYNSEPKAQSIFSRAKFDA